MTFRNSKHMKDCTNGGVTYGSIKDMSEDNAPISTQIHNHIVNTMCVSRRKKVFLTSDNQQDRKHKIKQRLREKLRKKKAKKQS